LQPAGHHARNRHRWIPFIATSGEFKCVRKGPKGKPGTLVGVFRMDGQRFVMATDTGDATGEVMGDQLEICWTDNIPNLIGAGCTVYKRQ
jgi:hypothetical protein